MILCGNIILVCYNFTAVQQQTLDTIPVVQQKRETSKEEMISNEATLHVTITIFCYLME